MKLKVIYRDAHILAVHKPAGIATYRESRGSGTQDSRSGAPGCKELLEDQLNQRLFPVHRIDADTSGVVLFALDSRSASAFIRLFKEHKITKTYLAWVEGTVEPRGTIKTPLKKNKSDETESARTDFERLQIKNGRSLVRVSPYTGRFHQIRRHFKGKGNPLVGDPIYNDAATKDEGLKLLAESLSFIHPLTRRSIVIKTKSEW